MEYLFAVIALVFGAVFAAAGLVRRGPFAAKSRLGLGAAALDAAAALLLARVLTPWTQLPPLLWLVPVAVVAVGVAGAVLRWGSLPALRPDRPRPVAIAGGVVNAVVVVALFVFVLG